MQFYTINMYKCDALEFVRCVGEETCRISRKSQQQTKKKKKTNTFYVKDPEAQ